MASAGVTFTVNSTTYVADLATFLTFAEANATEVEAARDGEASLLANIQKYIPLTGVGSNPDLNAKRIVNAADAVGSSDLTTLSQVNTLISGGGSPGDIQVMALKHARVKGFFYGQL